jgi:hypothetical protein
LPNTLENRNDIHNNKSKDKIRGMLCFVNIIVYVLYLATFRKVATLPLLEKVASKPLLPLLEKVVSKASFLYFF